MRPRAAEAPQVVLDSSAYLVYSDKAAAYIGNGGYKVEAADGTSRIYGSYSSAASHAAAGSVITLLNDYTGNETIYSGTSVSTLNLGGHTYTYTGKQQVVYINYDNAGINLKNGKVIATEKLDMAGVAMLYDNGTFTMEKVEMSIPGDSWGIGTNGSKVNNTILLKDSTLNVVDGLGIYFPGSGSVTIDNSVINAKHFGVQVCAGDLVITGANTSIVATGTAQPKTDGDGPILDGAAVSVVERDGYEDLGSVSIEGGSFKSDASSKAVKTYAFNSTDRVEGEWPEAGTVVEISGGSFSSPVAEDICADGFAPRPIPMAPMVCTSIPSRSPSTMPRGTGPHATSAARRPKSCLTRSNGSSTKSLAQPSTAASTSSALHAASPKTL